MNERVEEIRRKHEGFHFCEPLLTALAQAERERDEARAERDARARDVMHLEAETERLAGELSLAMAMDERSRGQRDKAEAETERLRAALRVVHQECREDRGEEDKHALAVRMMRLIETALEGRD